MGRKILVTGCSIAGNAVAWWLSTAGEQVTVVERAPAFRDGGQNVDVRGAARKVMARMGLEQAVADIGTGERGWSFVDETNQVVAEFDVAETGPDGPTAELEVLRGDLARLLHDQCLDKVEHRFGDSIRTLESTPRHVHVTFESGRQEAFDLVIVAEGVGSSTRELVFKGENDPRWLDVTMGYFTIPKGDTDTDVARWYNAPGGRSVFLRPDRKGTTRAVLTLQREARDPGPREESEQRAFLRREFQDAGWETPRVLDGLAHTQDLYFDVLRQVKLDRWSVGRVVLTGDAAWCATPLSGIGTTLAIVGAYVLAGESSKTQDHAQAFATYERVMRGFVAQGQGVPKFAARMANPHSRLGIALQRGMLGLAASPPLKKIGAKLFSPAADDIDLPDYDALSRA